MPNDLLSDQSPYFFQIDERLADIKNQMLTFENLKIIKIRKPSQQGIRRNTTVKKPH